MKKHFPLLFICMIAMAGFFVMATQPVVPRQALVLDDSLTGNGEPEAPMGATVAIVYMGRITQASTSAPTAHEYYNGIDPSVFTYTRDSIGSYKIEGSDAAFTDSTYQYLATISNSALGVAGVRCYRATDSTLIVKTMRPSGIGTTGIDLAGQLSLIIVDANPLGED
jgi:hypothetical protein